MADTCKKAERDYLRVVYREGQRPASSYPDHLAAELVTRAGLGQGSLLLDVGCGRGEMMAAFARSGLRCEGLDLADEAGGMLPGAKVTRADIMRERWPVEDSSCDAVFLKSVIEHLTDPAHLLAETMRVLAPGGALIVLTPDFASNFKVFYEDPTHVHPYVPKSLKALFDMHGFADSTSELFCHHEITWRPGTARFIADLLWRVLSTPVARSIAQSTGLKFIRWAVERQVLGIARKPANI